MKRNTDDGRIVAQNNVPVHSDFEGKVEIFRIEYLVDGLRVAGFIAKPQSMKHEPLPVLIYNRGGNREYGKIDDERLYRISSYAMENYVVLASQYRGNDGGEGTDEFGGADVRDVFALSWLADELPYVDRSKKVMFGHSRGGLMTYLCIKMGIDIKAAAVVGAPTNLLRRPLPFPMEQIHAELIGDPERDVEQYRERSALFWPDKINTPILILHGEQDSRVDPDDSSQLVELLQQHDVEHKYVVYPEGDHALTNYKTERDREIFQWFSRYL